jgi:hypothetical protein
MAARWLTETPMTENVRPGLAQDVLKSTANTIAGAIGDLATAPAAETDGKCRWVQGAEFAEVEDSFSRLCHDLIRTLTVI